MITLTFDMQIQAPREKVWSSLWDDANYREWTSVFTAGSYAKSAWQQGSRIDFLNPSGSGIWAIIDTLIPGTQMTFKHQGEIREGKDVDGGEWKGALESYFLSDEAGGTLLHCELQTTSDFQKYFNDTFPKAIEAVKHIAER